MITLERWLKFSLAQQLGNVGSELTRARLREESSDLDGCRKSLVAALELIDLSLDDRRWGKGLKEIARLREVVADWYVGTNVYAVPRRALEDYCISFILAQQNYTDTI